MIHNFSGILANSTQLGISGSDSTVFVTRNKKILKKYDKLSASLLTPSDLENISSLSKSYVLEVLEKTYNLVKLYKKDTEKAKEILKNNQQEISDTEIPVDDYSLTTEIMIISQGETFKGSDLSVYSFGQEFIPDFNGLFGSQIENINSDFLNDCSLTTQPMKYGTIADLATDTRIEISEDAMVFIQEATKPLAKILKKELNEDISIFYINVKPSMDSEKKVLYLKITDIAPNLKNMYSEFI